MIELIYFCLQAEDVIRDAQESRGLGDVYKRQFPPFPLRRPHASFRLLACVLLSVAAGPALRYTPVSYKHLTLPTIYYV